MSPTPEQRQIPWSDIIATGAPFGQAYCVSLEHIPSGTFAERISARQDTATALAYEELCQRVRP